MWWILILTCLSLFAKEPSALYLTWVRDPATTMTVQWHTPAPDPNFDAPEIETQTITYASSDKNWLQIDASFKQVDKLVVHTAHIGKLLPDTDYEFVLSGDTKTYKFRTAPADLKKPFRFCVGGDLYNSPKLFKRMAKTIVEQNPTFVVLTGELTGAALKPFASPLKRWCSFLKAWKENMVTKEGRLIPFVIVPNSQLKARETFFDLFALPKKQLYRTLDFGTYFSLFLLDSAIFHPVDGPQTKWLSNALAARENITYRLAVYNTAAHNEASAIAGEIRTHWLPLFNKYRLAAAIENEMYQRSSHSGLLHIGDSNWGKKNSALLIEMREDDTSVTTFDMLGSQIDSVSITSS